MGMPISSNEKNSVDLQLPPTDGERQLADPQVADALAGLFNESNPWLRQAVVGALEGLGEVAVKSLIVALSDSDAGVRRRVVEALGHMDDERIEEALTLALSDGNASVRSSAAAALGRLREERPVEPTTSADDEEKSDLPQTARDTETPTRYTKTVEPLITIRHTDPRMRVAAAERFGQLGDPRAAAPLIGLLGDSDSLVRQAATKALERLGDPAVELLITAVRDGNLVVQRQAIHVLANQKNVRQVEPFITALEKDDETMRADAIRALQRIGTPAALAAIQQHQARPQRLAKIKGVVKRLLLPAVTRLLRQPSS